MDEAHFSEAGTSRQREDLPYNGGFSQTKFYDDHSFSSKNALLDVSDQTISTAENRQERATQTETHRNADTAPALDKTPEYAVKEKSDQEQQGTTICHSPANRGDLAKPDISDSLQHDLSKGEFLKGPGINSKTLPEISNADRFDEAIVKNIILRYVMSSWPQEQTPALTDQHSPQRDVDSGDRTSGTPATTEGDASELGQPGATADSCHPESSQFLTKPKSPSNPQQGCHGQAPWVQQTENTGAGPGVRHHHGHYQGSDLSAAAPNGNNPKRDEVDKPLLTEKQASFTPGLRERLALVHNILESMSGPSHVEGAEQRRPMAEPVQQTVMEPTVHIDQGYITGIESNTSLLRLSPTSQKGPSSSSYIFQKLSQGEKMCQKLKEQTKRLENKVQEFSKSITQDSPCHMQVKMLVLEKVQGHLELLEQEFMANKEKHLTLKQQVHKHEPPAVSDFDPERKVEGEIFQLEMSTEDVKENTEGRHTVASPLPASSRTTMDDLPSTSSPSSKESLDQQALRRGHPGGGAGESCRCHAAVSTQKPVEAAVLEQGLTRVGVGSGVTCAPIETQASDAWVCMTLRPRFLLTSCQEDPHNTSSGRQDHMETTGWSCALCHRLLEWKRSQEERDHRRTSCGRCPHALPEKAMHPDSMLSPAAGLGLPSNGCAVCSTKTPDSPRGHRGEPPKEFHYRYNTPGQNYFSHSAGSPFFQLCFLNENKHSSSSCSKPNWIHSQTANSKSPQDAQEPVPGNADSEPILRNSLIVTRHGPGEPVERGAAFRFLLPQPPYCASPPLRKGDRVQEESPFMVTGTTFFCSSAVVSHKGTVRATTGRGKSLKASTTCSSDLATSSLHYHPSSISGSKPVSTPSSARETKPEGLSSSLDYALRTAMVLKETTDQMIRTIAEDLAKVQRWRNRLKY
ncbi:LOW QUALITY PROTEIN: protein AKNAD1 [Rhynchonycteris naso]